MSKKATETFSETNPCGNEESRSTKDKSFSRGGGRKAVEEPLGSEIEKTEKRAECAESECEKTAAQE